jgi:hypothetical protein
MYIFGHFCIYVICMSLCSIIHMQYSVGCALLYIVSVLKANYQTVISCSLPFYLRLKTPGNSPILRFVVERVACFSNDYICIHCLVWDACISPFADCGFVSGTIR